MISSVITSTEDNAEGLNVNVKIFLHEHDKIDKKKALKKYENLLRVSRHSFMKLLIVPDDTKRTPPCVILGWQMLNGKICANNKKMFCFNER